MFGCTQHDSLMITIYRMFITGIIPTTALIYLNWGIHKADQTRKKHQRQSTSNNINNMGNTDLELSPLPPRAKQLPTTPPATATTSCVSHLSCSLPPALEESRMALILMFIVVTYMVTNTPRMILNFYEFLVSEQRQKDKHCHIHPR